MIYRISVPTYRYSDPEREKKTTAFMEGILRVQALPDVVNLAVEQEGFNVEILVEYAGDSPAMQKQIASALLPWGAECPR